MLNPLSGQGIEASRPVLELVHIEFLMPVCFAVCVSHTVQNAQIIALGFFCSNCSLSMLERLFLQL